MFNTSDIEILKEKGFTYEEIIKISESIKSANNGELIEFESIINDFYSINKNKAYV